MNTAAINFSLTFPKKRGNYLLFSLPQTNHYQKISNLATTPGGCRKVAGNRIAIFTLNDVLQEVKIDFHAKLKSFSSSINKNYKISDYKKTIFPSNRFINGQDPKIIKMARKIVEKEQSLNKIILNLYSFTRNYLTYGKPTEGLYTYKQAVEERMTDCGGFSTFLASLLQSQNIPSRLVVGYIIKKNIMNRFFSFFKFQISNFKFLSIHAWLEVMLPDKSLFPIDPSTGKFGQIPANRLVTSFGCDFNLKINKKNYQVDILQSPIYI